MDLDVIVQTFGWSDVLLFVVYCLAVFAMSFLARRIVETASPRVKVSVWWCDVILPSVPIFLGVVVAAAARGYPFPSALSVLSGRLLYGVVAGFLSGWVYRIVKGAFSAKAGVTLPDPGVAL